MRALFLAAIAAATVTLTAGFPTTEAEARCIRCGPGVDVGAPRAGVGTVGPRRNFVGGPCRVVAR
jgi:hypothetical protein